MKKKLHPYVFYGGAFGVALLAVVLASGTATTDAATAFLSQSDTSSQVSTEIVWYQQLSCEDLHYDIASVDTILSGGAFGSPQAVALSFGTLSGSGVWNKLKKRVLRTSETVQFKEAGPSTVAFHFNPPVAVQTLCRNTSDTVYMTFERSVRAAPHPFVHGSKNPNAYRSALYGCVLESGSPCMGDVADVAFTFRTLPNKPPVIAQVTDQSVNELMSLTFALQATDPNSDTVRWGSSNLPDGAALNETTGVFTWTPESGQAKEYKVTFIATDNGGPIEESASITITITVHNVTTPPEVQRTLYENVLAYGFETSIENSYIAHLKNVDTFLARGQFDAAANQLNAFIRKVAQDLEQGTITEGEHAQLTKDAQSVLTTITLE